MYIRHLEQASPRLQRGRACPEDDWRRQHPLEGGQGARRQASRLNEPMQEASSGQVGNQRPHRGRAEILAILRADLATNVLPALE